MYGCGRWKCDHWFCSSLSDRLAATIVESSVWCGTKTHAHQEVSSSTPLWHRSWLAASWPVVSSMIPRIWLTFILLVHWFCVICNLSNSIRTKCSIWSKSNRMATRKLNSSAVACTRHWHYSIIHVTQALYVTSKAIRFMWMRCAISRLAPASEKTMDHCIHKIINWNAWTNWKHYIGSIAIAMHASRIGQRMTKWAPRKFDSSEFLSFFYSIIWDDRVHCAFDRCDGVSDGCKNVLCIPTECNEFMIQCIGCGKYTNILKGLKAVQVNICFKALYIWYIITFAFYWLIHRIPTWFNGPRKDCTERAHLTKRYTNIWTWWISSMMLWHHRSKIIAIANNRSRIVYWNTAIV